GAGRAGVGDGLGEAAVEALQRGREPAQHTSRLVRGRRGGASARLSGRFGVRAVRVGRGGFVRFGRGQGRVRVGKGPAPEFVEIVRPDPLHGRRERRGRFLCPVGAAGAGGV